VDVYRLISTEVDPRTGVKTVVKDVFRLKRGIILPSRITLTEIRGISLISANKRLVQGGQFESQSQKVIIDRSDVPDDLQLTTDDWIVVDSLRHDIKHVDSLEFDAGWLLTTRAVHADVPEQIFLAKAESLLTLTDGVVDVV